MGALSIAWTVFIILIDTAQNTLNDSVTALGFMIAFYYGFTDLACVLFYRRELFKTVRNFVMVGVVPLLGFALMAVVFGFALHDFSQPDYNYSPPVAGFQVPILIGIGGLLVGIPLMLLAWLRFPRFFQRRPYFEMAPEGALEGLVTVETVAPEDDAATGGGR
jgi:hypothetical protein